MRTGSLTRAATLLAATIALTVGAAVPAHAVSGTTYEDVDADGTFGEADRPLAEVPVYADLNGDGFRDEGEPVSVSRGDGTWGLDGLAPGSYVIRQDPEPGWRCSAPSGCVHSVALALGDAASGRDFGSWRPGRVLGTVFDDADRDGVRGLGELPRVRAALYLDVDGDAAQDEGEPTTSSGIDGSFAFNGLRPGLWTVRQVSSAGWRCSAPAACAYTVRVRSSEEVSGLVFANWHESEPPPPRETTMGTPVLRAQLAADTFRTLEWNIDSETGRETFKMERPSACVPVTVQVPIGEEQGPVQGARLLLVDAHGSEQSIALEDAPPAPADGFWSGTIPCVRAGTLEVVAVTAAGSVRSVVGQIAFTSPPVERDVSPKPSCLVRPVTARVRGRTIRRVVFYLDGRHFRTVTRADSTGRFRVTVHRRALSSGRHVLRAKVIFVPSANRPPAFLTLPFTRCLASSRESAVTAGPLPSCVSKPFAAWIRGDRVRNVRFRLEGKPLGSVSVADWRGRYGVRVDPGSLAAGSHVILARVEFIRGSGLRSRTVRLPFTTCA